MRNQLQVGPGTSKLLGHRPQPSVVAGQSELQEACRVGRPAVAVVIGRESVSSEQHRSGEASGAGGRGSRGDITRSPHQFESLQGLLSTGGIDALHREAHVDQHPVTGSQVLPSGSSIPMLILRETPDTSTKASWPP